MNTLRMLIQSFIIALAAATLAPAHAAPEEEPVALIERISREVLNIAKTDPEVKSGNRKRILDLVRQKILPHIDFERMTALAAGRYWRRATPEQQVRLVSEFRDLLVHVYSGALSQVKNEELVFNAMRGDLADGEVEVHSEVVRSRSSEPLEVNYRLVKEPSGWKIYDVSVLGVWLVQSYRGSFANEIRNSGIDGLIHQLAEKNKRLSASAG